MTAEERAERLLIKYAVSAQDEALLRQMYGDDLTRERIGTVQSWRGDHGGRGGPPPTPPVGRAPTAQERAEYLLWSFQVGAADEGLLKQMYGYDFNVADIAAVQNHNPGRHKRTFGDGVWDTLLTLGIASPR